MQRIALVGTTTAVLLAAAAWSAPGKPAPKKPAAGPRAERGPDKPAELQPAAPGDRPEQAPDVKVEPASIWPASLERIAGRYVYVQVASPGGLWERGPAGRKQVSINELTPEMRDRLTHAEITISGLKLPAEIEAVERVSPSKRGKLRYYEENAAGRLVMHNLPGIGSTDGDKGEFTGPVVFTLQHNSHSNPSVFGILNLRQHQESTWGVATVDYADLSAVPVVEGAKGDAEIPPAIGNARILRSGVEIFAFVNWEEQRPDGEHTFMGAVRLARELPAPQQMTRR